MNRSYALDAAKDYRTKATPGITGWFRLSVQSDGGVRHLDVGSTYPGGGEAPKGMAVRHLKSYASWVQTVQNKMKRFKEAKKEKLIFPSLNLSFFQLYFE
ncbi:MAG: hypothetical protein A3D37_02430 [Candidatus Zambryskibacteria bacterium RIFCSPHIGHO2_02_FULL_38_22]|nr:MAG: hypothetical protein A3D37_02430 [Candidatus Zambryskibacteria bacterium RIFCSPHIGHO2_02_FULL_38_22]OHB07665.1 MAG: hypothetical protein A3I19_00900 [Candidatus Zambryskibacteria bacterium RIFCSPLOWO2_02_FULL_38_13]